MERNSEKRRRARYATDQPISSSFKYRDNAENAKTINDSRKYRQNGEIDETNDKNERRRSNQTSDNECYHCPEDVEKASRRHGVLSSSRVKYVDPYDRGEFLEIENKTRNQLPRLSRNDFLQQYVNTKKYGKNIAVVRKDHRREHFQEVEEPENSTFCQDNTQADETNEEIVDEERNEGTSELKKCYEQREALDETDEEIDDFQPRPDKTTLRRKVRTESSSGGQKISSAPMSSRHHRGSKFGTGKTLERCCRSAVDRRSPEIPTGNEDDECLLYCPRKTSWKSRSRDENSWIPRRKFMERYSNMAEKSPLPDIRQTRRPRTTRPEMEKSMKSTPRYESTSNVKCDRCGRASEKTPKTISSRNASCRLQDSRCFLGEAKEFFEDSTSVPMTCRTKPRRSRGSRSPIYESNEKTLTIDKDDGNEARGTCKSRRGNDNSRGTNNSRRSSVRADDRREEQSKNSKYYWTER